MARLSFTSKADFLENNFMSNFIGKGELCLEKLFGKTLTTALCIDEKEK